MYTIRVLKCFSKLIISYLPFGTADVRMVHNHVLKDQMWPREDCTSFIVSQAQEVEEPANPCPLLTLTHRPPQLQSWQIYLIPCLILAQILANIMNESPKLKWPNRGNKYTTAVRAAGTNSKGWFIFRVYPQSLREGVPQKSKCEMVALYFPLCQRARRAKL